MQHTIQMPYKMATTGDGKTSLSSPLWGLKTEALTVIATIIPAAPPANQIVYLHVIIKFFVLCLLFPLKHFRNLPHYKYDDMHIFYQTEGITRILW